MKYFLALILVMRAVHAQVTIAATPEPLAVMNSLHVRTMGMWGVFIRNEGLQARTISPEDVYIALISIKPIDPAAAIIVLNDRQSHSTSARITKILSYAGQGTGIALALVSKSNVPLGIGISIGSQVIPQLTSIFQADIPSTQPFIVNLLNSSVTLMPGQSVTRNIFADKQKSPTSLIVKVP